MKAMKLTFILLTASFLQLSASGLSQNVTISLKDAPVEKVFREIERQTSIGFLYTKKMLQESGKVTINVKNVSVEDVLKQCFYGKSLDFVIQNNTIVITKKYKAVIEEENPVAPPAIDIKGRVTDTEGEPLAGVSVLVTGTNTGTTTNANGEYSLAGIDANNKLTFSIVGYTSQTVSLKSGSTINIVLSVEVKQHSCCWLWFSKKKRSYRCCFFH